MRRTIHRLGLRVCVALAASAASCTDIRETRIDGERPPADFAVDVTILTGVAAKDLPSAHTRQGKLSLLADGSLHADFGDSLSFSTRPAPTRWLYEEQVESLWSLAQREGWLDPAQSTPSIWPGSVKAARDEIVYLLWFHADGTDWWFVRRFRTNEIPDPHAVALVRSMCELAWATDRAPDRNLPHRYDFGPNPYAGFAKALPYRRNAPAEAAK
ncbi:MAG: hypothetical protein EXS03_04615 [Phycisphaerales bacterium]|nr:hypothetical protein [Phycisphaerales bacterium]